ncbi:MAG: FAD-dependent monooxygenase [Actinomycetota bacterium]|nr:FAD-dependent monooxygenase [Actinomycetota bacterium]
MTRAIIVGGGIGGLTAAVALRRAGIEATVLERAGGLREVGAGISIWVNAMQSLEGLGLAEAVRAAGREEIGGEVRTARGATLSRIPAQTLEERFGRNVVLTRPDLQWTLSAALEAAGGSVCVGAECIGFRQERQGVAALFADGREERGDLLVGADGLNSVVRLQLFGEERPRYAGFTAWRGLADLGRDVEGFEAWGRGSVFGLVGLGLGRFYWYGTKNAPEGQGDSQAGRKAEVLERFGGWHEPIPAVIRATPEAEILRNDVYDREPLQSWGEGRVTLLGDAAHPMTPNLGQGACQAIEDAAELAGCLRVGGDDVVGALRLYEDRRRGRTAEVARRSRLLSRVVQLENPLLCAARNAAARAMPDRLQLRQLEAVLARGM